MLAKDIYKTFDEETKKELYQWMMDTLKEVEREEYELIEEVYNEIGMVHDVKVFFRYNCNKAFMNLGFDYPYEEEEVNPIVMNGLNTETKTHDFFSMKGNGYQKAKIEEVRDDDFNF